MAFCPNCGAQAAGAFCPNCGASIGGPAPGATAPNPGGYVPPQAVVATSGIEPHIAAALCYLPIAPFGLLASIIFLVAAPYNQNKFIRFNAFQSLFLHAATIVGFIVLGIVFAIIAVILHVLGFLASLLLPVLWLAVLGLFLYMMYVSFNNKKVVLPIIGDLANKQA